MNPRRILEVASEQAAVIDERYPDYRAALIRCLIDVITAQDEGLSDRGRRDRVERIVEAFGGKVSVETRKSP
jgi:hypothetical protein